jgi:hypothetical protein
MSFHGERGSDAKDDQNPDNQAGVPKESVDHEATPLFETAYKFYVNAPNDRHNSVIA